MILGIRAHDIDCSNLNINDLSRRISQKGIKSVQLVLHKAINDFDTSVGKLNPGMANYIKNNFNKNDIQIAIMGCYINLIHPDIVERKQSIERFKEHIRYARDFGCSIVGTETGSYMADCSYDTRNNSEEAFVQCIKSIKELVEEAEKFGVLVGIEAVTTHVINSPERVKRMIDLIESYNLQIIFDPVNLLDENNYLKQNEIIERSLELFGDRIVLVHAKDFVIDDGKMVRTAPGKGLFNYELLLKKLKYSKPYINVIMEELLEEDMDDSIKTLYNIYDRI